MTHYVGLYNYWIVIFLMMTGFYIVIARSNLIQKIIGLNIFQISVFLLYITMGKVTGGTAPILPYHHDHHADAASHQQHEHDASPAPVVHAESQETHGDETHGEDPVEVAHTEARNTVSEHAEEGHAEAEHADMGHTNSDHEHDSHSTDAGHAGDEEVRYTHPLPSVLMLTAIVVGVATTALALALVIRIGEAYGTIEEDEILQRDREEL